MLAIMIICAVLETVLVGAWLYLFVKYRNQFDGLLDDVDGKTFTLKDLYFIGLGAIETYEPRVNVRRRRSSICPRRSDVKTQSCISTFPTAQRSP